MRLANKLVAAFAVVLLAPALAPGQEVFREISSQRLEDILKGMNIQTQKGTDNKGTTWYDFTSKNQLLRLTNFSGKDLMIDVFLPKSDWETINKWNGTAKFSRARLNKDNKGVENSVIEWNLDLMGGVTEETVRHFIRSFDQEVAVWLKSPAPAPGPGPAPPPGPGPGPLPKPPPPGPIPPPTPPPLPPPGPGPGPAPGPNPGPGSQPTDEATFKNVTPEMVERILNGLNINFKKTQGKGNNVYWYDFNRNNFNIRLTTWGQDLMIDCQFPQMQLAKLNEWNVKRNYVRAVLYTGASPYSALESNLDCMGGVSESMIRYFVTTFDVELTAFDNHVKGAGR